MAEKVLLINAPSENRYFPGMLPPLGALYLTAVLRKNLISTDFVDLNLSRNWIKELRVSINSFKPRLVGISSNISNTRQALTAAFIIKSINKDLIVFLGGPGPTARLEDYLSGSIDFIIPFEAERIITDFVRAQDRGLIEGVIRCNDGQIVSGMENLERMPVENLDDLPFPAYDLLDIKGYYETTYKRRPIVSMVTSRGCPSNCIFCSRAVSGNKWRARSAENVVDEMEWLKKEIGAREIAIQDDNFTLDQERAQKICELIKKRKLNISWQLDNGVRVDKLSKDLLALMKESGCWKIVIAPEVGDKKEAKYIKKGISFNKFMEASSWCKEIGMVYHANFIMGFPFQNKESLEKQIDFAIELDPLIVSFAKLTVFPGTELFDKKKKYKRRDTFNDFSDKNNLLGKMFCKAHFNFYFRPRKIIEIIKTIGIKLFIRGALFVTRAFFRGKANGKV